MAKFRCIVADPPWNFSDHLTMSETKRGSASNYDTLTVEDLKNLPVKDICEEDSILILWVPSSLLADGLDVMSAWGFRQTQTHVWIKTKNVPLRELAKQVIKAATNDFLSNIIEGFCLDNILAFGLGRLFRQTHELALVGVRGKIYKYVENKSQRSVHFGPVTKHSSKPESLQDKIDKIFSGNNKLEMFARRDRPGWICIGNESPSTFGQDIRDSLKRLANENFITR